MRWCMRRESQNLRLVSGYSRDSPETLQPSALPAKQEVRPEITQAALLLGIMRARFAASLVGEEPVEPRTVWVDQHRSRFEENISASSALVACRYLQPCPTQVISRRMPQLSERPSTSPVNAVRVQANGTMSPVINESGHESAVTLHRATYIERGWRYYCPLKRPDAPSPGQSTSSDVSRPDTPQLSG